jgi:ribosome maturation factor RimP
LPDRRVPGRDEGERMASNRDDRLEAELREIVGPIVDSAGADLVDVEAKGHPGSRVVRVVVDAADGVTIEQCAELSRQIGSSFDELDPIPGRYTLQVTSPGADRPLSTERDFVRNVGRPVRIRVRSGDHGELEGVVVAVDARTVVLERDGDRTEVALADVDDARVQLPW